MASPGMPAALFSRRGLFFLLQAAISLGALGYALAGVDLPLLWQALRGYAPWAVGLSLCALALDYACMGLRLHTLLSAGTRYALSLKAVLLCVGYNNILPAKAGDAMKVVFLTRKTGMSLLDVSSIILWERLLDVLSLLCVALLAYTLLGTGQRLLLPVLLVLGGGGLFFCLRCWSAWFHAAYARFFPGRMATLCSRLHEQIIDKISLPRVLRGFVLSLGTWSCYFASFVISLRLVAGLPLDGVQMLTVFAVTCLGMAIPSSPGGLGVFEGAMVLSLSWFGVEQSAALGIALYTHALHFLPAALAALLLNGSRGFWKAADQPASSRRIDGQGDTI